MHNRLAMLRSPPQTMRNLNGKSTSNFRLVLCWLREPALQPVRHITDASVSSETGAEGIHDRFAGGITAFFRDRGAEIDHALFKALIP